MVFASSCSFERKTKATASEGSAALRGVFPTSPAWTKKPLREIAGKLDPGFFGVAGFFFGGGGGVFLLEVQYSVLKSLISTCVLSYVGSRKREDWLLDRICESKKDCWDSIRRTSYPYQ